MLTKQKPWSAFVALGILAVLAGCSGSGETNPPGNDGGFGGDMAMTPGMDMRAPMDIGASMDQAPPPSDLANTPLPALSIDDVSLQEGTSGSSTITFTVTLSQASTQAITVDFTTADGTAKSSDGDYNAQSGTLAFAPGTTTRTIAVQINGDPSKEPDETFTIRLSNSSNATIAQGTGTGLILNDDAIPSLRIYSTQALEGNAGTTDFVFNVLLSATSGQTISVDFATGGGPATPGTDYMATSGTLTFPPGTTTQTITVKVNGDLNFEANEGFNVTLSNPVNATISTAMAYGGILDDDGPTVSVDNPIIDEGNSGTKTATFTITLSKASTSTVTVQYFTGDFTATSSSSAIGGADYVPTSGTLTFPPGTTTQTVAVTVNGDTVYEDAESFVLNLASPVNANLTPNTGGFCTINTDDTPPTLSISDVTIMEGDAGNTNLVFVVTQSAITGAQTQFQFATADVMATQPSDYTRVNTSVVINPGNLSVNISVPIVGDLINENDETFNAVLSNPRNATIAKATGVGTILNDDMPPNLQINDVTLTEGSTGNKFFTFTVSLNVASGKTITVNFGTADGTAMTANLDYVATSGTLTFNAGTTSRTISVLLTGDTNVEADETFSVNLSAPVNATIARGTGTGTIVNDD